MYQGGTKLDYNSVNLFDNESKTFSLIQKKAYGFCSLVTVILRQFEVLEDEECTEKEVKDYVQGTF